MNEKQAIKLLKKYSSDEKSFKKVLAHSKVTKRIALRIAKKIKGVDLELVKVGSLLHDIGRFKAPPKIKGSIRHGLEGSKILRKEGYPKLARICERHLGVGLNKKDIAKQKLDLPKKDFIPKTIEEKIIAYADNFAFGEKEKKLKDVTQRYRVRVGKEYVKRILKIKKELEA